MVRLVALCGVFLISFSAVFVRLASVSPATAATFRCLYALPVLVLLWRLRSGRDGRGPRERWMSFLAGAALGLDLVFWHRAIDLIGTGLATVLGNTQVVFVAFLAWLVHRERPSRWALGLTPLVLVGVALLTGLGQADAYGADPASGVIFGLLTGLSYSAFLILLRASNRGLSTPEGPLLDATAGAAVASLLAGLVEGGLDLVPHWPAHGWLFAVAMVSQVFGWLAITYTLPRLAALETSVLLLLQPLLTVLWGYLLFVERLSATQWAGAALVLAGVGSLSLLGSVEKR
ncbi:MAG: DMT family transporter [Acidobacteriota bacterium]